MKRLIERFKDRHQSIQQAKKTRIQNNLNKIFFTEKNIPLEGKKKITKFKENYNSTQINYFKKNIIKNREHSKSNKPITHRKTIDSSDKLCAWEPINGPTTPFDEISIFRK